MHAGAGAVSEKSIGEGVVKLPLAGGGVGRRHSSRPAVAIEGDAEARRRDQPWPA